MSLFFTHIKLAEESIRENKTRSFLTCLGIAIGVASIILILSLTGSVNRLVKEQTKDLGEELIVVRPDNASDVTTDIIRELTSSNAYQKSNLAIEDVKVISEIEGVEAVAPVAITSTSVVTEKNTVQGVPVVGTTSDFFNIQPLTLRYGTTLSDRFNNNTVLVGHTAALVLFNTSNPVGKSLTIYGERFIVVGVLSETENSVNINNIDFDNSVIADIEALDKVSHGLQIQQIDIKAINIESLEVISNKISAILTERKGGDASFSVSFGDQIIHPASTMFNIISGMLTLVACISLVVGGIGVMNIMLVSVNERTHEIGIRKAIGASSRNILEQFLFEALILSLLGGFFGLVLGYILAFFVSIITPFPPFISMNILFTTFAVSVIVGIVFGIYPALKAAVRNPIDSLKHYH